MSRFRPLEISLAVKCQILFGAAVVLIIAAALAVPWHRMEQLTQQLDERAAGVLSDDALARHLSLYGSRLSPSTRDAPSTRPDLEATDSIPRLLGAGTTTALSLFERRAISQFIRKEDREPVSKYYDNEKGRQTYRYARPLFLKSDCVSCHHVEQRMITTPAGASLMPVLLTHASRPDFSEPSSKPAKAEKAPFIGMVSIEMTSRIDPRQLLLNRVFILGAGLLAGTLAIIAFYVITTRLILQPVRVLRETAERVSEGDLNVRSDINTGDEFQQLSETFNTMLVNLKQSSDQLRSINKSLDLKLGQLAESNLALYESNRLKSEFLANVSHELRTPLNSILGFADLLKDTLGTGGESKSTRYATNILNSAKNLLDLINDLLDLAKIEAGRMEIRSEPLSLPDVFEGLVNLLRPMLEAKGLTLTTAAEADVPVIHTDPAKLQQVLYNFLSNAIKFSPVGERIELAARLDTPGGGADESGEGYVRISVTDHGPGIELDHQALIFEKFRQVDASVTRTHSGTGLGLAIAKELATLLRGSIGVQSARDQGATFWIVLPLRIQSGAMDVRGKLVWT